MMQNFYIFACSLFFVARGATLATKYSARLARCFRLSRYVIGFIVVALISMLPEALVAINSAFNGMPAFGLGTLFGSNVADLTLVFAILVAVAGRGIKIESKVLKNVLVYPLFLLIPLILGLNGYYSRLDGILLILSGAIFYLQIFKSGNKHVAESDKSGMAKNITIFFFSILMLLAGAHYTVVSASALAINLNINPILIAMLVVGLGTTIPELFFSIKSIKKRADGLAVGDILGTVLADATIVVGIVALISPFEFPVKIIYISGFFMLVASLLLLGFMRSGKTLSRKEGLLLFLFWATYVILEFTLNK